jgi:hypothetical protein
MSLGEEAFAEAVAAWQRKQGFSEKDSDGIIGSNTWRIMKPIILGANDSQQATTSSLTKLSTAVTVEDKYIQQWGSNEEMGKHIDRLAYSELPSLAGKKIGDMTEAEKTKFKATWMQIRKIILDQRRILVASGFAPITGGVAVPFGFKEVSYKSFKGLSSELTTERLDKVLSQLHKQKKIKITQEQLDVFQRISNVETSGKIQTLNTFDLGIVSIGFMQFTLHVGKIQQWIKIDTNAFRRYGLELDPSEKYDFGDNEKHPAIKEVPQNKIDNLRWNGWAERFYYAGLDPDVITAEITLALKYLEKHLSELRKRLNAPAVHNSFVTNYYNKNNYVRGLFQASYNNNPSRSTKCIRKTFDFFASSTPLLETFLEKYKQMLRDAGWERLVNETANGTTLSLMDDGLDKEFEDLSDKESFVLLEDFEDENNSMEF